MLTRKEQLTEFAKCLVNPIYVIETYFSTFDKTKEGIVPFKLFPRQKEIIYAYESHNRNLVTKPRQAGVSTTTAAYLAIKAGFAPKENPEAILIIANKQELAFEFLSKIKAFVSQLPRWLWGPEFYGSEKNESKAIYSTESKKEIMLPNGSRIKAVATSKDALRGFTPTYLVMDEAAFIDNGKEVYGAAMTSLGTGGAVILISTPHGHDPLYYETYKQAKSKDNNYNIVEMKWYEDLRYNKDLQWIKGDERIDEVEFTLESYKVMIDTGYKPTSTWYRAMCQTLNNDPKAIAQELDVSFLGSGGNVIAEEDIEYQEKFNVKEPLMTRGDEIWIWELPKEGHQYLIPVDVSRGDSEDYSAFSVLDMTTMEQVMEYRGRIPPDKLGDLADEFGRLYGGYIIVDITGGMGVATVLRLLELKYPKLHYDVQSGKVLDYHKTLSSFNKENRTPGFTFNNVRTPMIAHLEYVIRERLFNVRSARVTNEMKSFIYKNGRADHRDGQHDDCLMVIAMGLWIYEHSFKNLQKLESKSKAMLEAWLTHNRNEIAIEDNKKSGFVTIQNGQKVKTNKPNFSPIVKKNMQDPNGEYMWLFSGFK